MDPLRVDLVPSPRYALAEWDSVKKARKAKRQDEKKEKHDEKREIEHVSKHAYDHLSEAREDDI